MELTSYGAFTIWLRFFSLFGAFPCHIYVENGITKIKPMKLTTQILRFSTVFGLASVFMIGSIFLYGLYANVSFSYLIGRFLETTASSLTDKLTLGGIFGVLYIKLSLTILEGKKLGVSICELDRCLSSYFGLENYLPIKKLNMFIIVPQIMTIPGLILSNIFALWSYRVVQKDRDSLIWLFLQ